MHRVNTALSMLRVRQGAVICPSMAGALVRGFGLTFLPLRQPTVKWRIALFAATPDVTLAGGGKLPQFHAGVRPELGGNRMRREAARPSGASGFSEDIADRYARLDNPGH